MNKCQKCQMWTKKSKRSGFCHYYCFEIYNTKKDTFQTIYPVTVNYYNCRYFVEKAIDKRE